MKHGKRLRWRRLMIVALTLATTIAFAFSRGNASHAAETPRLTSAEIADGLLFSEGSAAEYVTSMRQDVEWTDDMRDFQHRIKAAMASDAYYNDTFAQQMQSGDPILAEEALNQFAETVRGILEKVYGPERVVEILGQVQIAWETDLGAPKAKNSLVKPGSVYKEIYNSLSAILFAINVVAVWAVYVLFVFFAKEPGTGQTLLAREIQSGRIAADLHYLG